MSYYDLRKNPHVILRSNYIICHTPPQGIIHLPYRNSRTDIWAMQGMINSRFRTLLPQGRLAWDLQVMRATNTWLEWWVRIPSEFWMPIETIAIAWVPLACASIFSKDQSANAHKHTYSMTLAIRLNKNTKVLNMYPTRVPCMYGTTKSNFSSFSLLVRSYHKPYGVHHPRHAKSISRTPTIWLQH